MKSSINFCLLSSTLFICILFFCLSCAACVISSYLVSASIQLDPFSYFDLLPHHSFLCGRAWRRGGGWGVILLTKSMTVVYVIC
uniref:Putative ovule protein n=1 Tax=Solanum chacoense TaxID=4108 RepID=A0A0V0GTE9_SOLCH